MSTSCKALENKVTDDHADKKPSTALRCTRPTADHGPRLMDMKGSVVHQWQMPFRQAWPQPTHVDPAPENQYWFGVHVYPNGDLLAVYHAKSDTPYGYGLVKMDKDSKLLWRYSDHVHHMIDVGDDGTIYALTQKLSSKAPAGMDFIPVPHIADALGCFCPPTDRCWITCRSWKGSATRNMRPFSS